MAFIYIDYHKSSIKLDNGHTVNIWFDEYCEAKEVHFPDQDLDVTDSVCDSFYVMLGGALVKLNDLLKAAEKHMELCRKEDDQDAEEYNDHVKQYGRVDYSAS